MQNNLCQPISTRSHYAKLLSWPSGRAPFRRTTRTLETARTTTTPTPTSSSSSCALATRHVHWLCTNAASSSWPQAQKHKKKKISKRKKHEPEEYQLVRNASFIPAAFKHSSNFCGLGLDFKVFRFCIKHAQQIPRTQIAVNSGSSLSKVFGLTIH